MIALWWMLVCYMIALPISLIVEGDYLLAFSFYLNAVVIAYMSRVSLVKNVAGPAFATVNAFFLLFLYAAPVYQILEYKTVLINNYSPTLAQMIGANLMILLFICTFVILYLRRLNKAHVPLVKTDDDVISSTFPLFMALAAVMAIWGISLMLSENVDFLDDTAAIGIDIVAAIRHKVALVIPFAALGFYIYRKSMRRSWIIVGILLVFVLLTKNIVLDRRNSIGPIYLALFFMVLWRGRVSSRSVFILVGLGLLIVFPIVAIFINNPITSWGDLVNLDNMAREIRGHFTDMHYDAWASVVAGIQYVQTEGFQLGRQLLGSLLFFWPRQQWADKPMSTGETLGQYLVDYHGLWFTNISAPLPLEGFIDFGIFGVILYAIILAVYSQRLDYFINRGGAVDRTSSLYFAFYLTFVMRGAFLPAFAYGVGAYIALNLFPALLSFIRLRDRFGGARPLMTGARAATMRRRS